VRKSFVPALALALAGMNVGCGDAVHRPIPSGAPQPRVAPTPASAHVSTPTSTERRFEPLERLEASGRPPVDLSASAVEGYPPLPTYRAKVRNVSDRPVRRVIATVVYLDAEGRAMPGENQDVAFGSPLKPIDPGTTLETSFLSRVDRAPGIRLVVRVVVLLEEGGGGETAPREWQNPRYEAELARAGSGR
jgi:hypothetical protein